MAMNELTAPTRLMRGTIAADVTVVEKVSASTPASCQHAVVAATDWITAIGSAATPVVVAGFGYAISQRLTRSGELLKARLDYYKALAPDLNKLMTYMTFIGRWRDISPIEVVALKRDLDSTFFCAAPLFSKDVIEHYDAFMKLTFSTFNDWGEDAKIVSNAYRRRQSWRGDWPAEWDAYFALADDTTISADDLSQYRKVYDALVAAMVKDLNVNRAREQYTTDQVSLNAHAPKRTDVTGSTSA